MTHKTVSRLVDQQTCVPIICEIKSTDSIHNIKANELIVFDKLSYNLLFFSDLICIYIIIVLFALFDEDKNSAFVYYFKRTTIFEKKTFYTLEGEISSFVLEVFITHFFYSNGTRLFTFNREKKYSFKKKKLRM